MRGHIIISISAHIGVSICVFISIDHVHVIVSVSDCIIMTVAVHIVTICVYI
jgi:hypothetical protein